jgi:hypothetical protein
MSAAILKAKECVFKFEGILMHHASWHMALHLEWVKVQRRCGGRISSEESVTMCHRNDILLILVFFFSITSF